MPRFAFWLLVVVAAMAACSDDAPAPAVGDAGAAAGSAGAGGPGAHDGGAGRAAAAGSGGDRPAAAACDVPTAVSVGDAPETLAGTLAATAVGSWGCAPGGAEATYRLVPKADGSLDVSVFGDEGLRVVVADACSGDVRACGRRRVRLALGAREPVLVSVQGPADLAYGLGVVVTAPACGDGYRDPDEACDDGNDVDGDGCDDACRLESDEGGPNDDRASADEARGARYVGTLEGSTDVDVIAVDIAVDGDALDAEVADLDGVGCVEETLDAALSLIDGDGTIVAAAPDVACGRLSAANLAAGRYYLKVGPKTTNGTDPYLLFTTFDRCGNGKVDVGEECDDGDRLDDETCTATCTLPFL